MSCHYHVAQHIISQLVKMIVCCFCLQGIVHLLTCCCAFFVNTWQPTAGFITHVTCRLTAKNRDQLRNHTLGNRVWAIFAFMLYKMHSKSDIWYWQESGDG